MKLYYFLLIILLYTQSILAYDIATPNTITNEYDSTCCKKKDNIFLNLSMTMGKNPYFCHSFYTTKLLYLPKDSYAFSPLLSFHSIISDSTEHAFSLGGGFRNYFSCLNSTFGVNAFYDLKHFNIEKFHQIGVGFESLSFFEIRANFYFPLIKSSQSKITHNFINKGKLIEFHTSKTANACELEFGKRIQQNFTDLYFSIAPYFIFNEASGIEYKAQVRWKSILYFGVSIYQHFHCRSSIEKGAGETITGVIGINIPLGAESSEKKSLNRIPISRWDTIRNCLIISFKNK